MNFAIIAAGNGERLRSEGVNLPKPLVPINNIPMLGRLLTIISAQNPESINIIVNEEAKEVYDFIAALNLDNKINVKVKSTPSSLHSLFELKTLLNGKPFCLFTVDSIFLEHEFENFINFVKSNIDSYDAVLGITEYVKDEKPLHVELDNNNIIVKFNDEIDSSSFVTGGIYFFTPKIFNEIDFAVRHNYHRLRNFLKLLLTKNYLIKGYRFSKIVDVDHIDDVKTAEEFLSPEIK